MTYKTLKVGDHIKCFSRDEAETLIYILENDGFKCNSADLKDGQVDVFVCSFNSKEVM